MAESGGPLARDYLKARNNYLLACFRSARSELTFRVRHRDNWLKLALLTQVAVFALAHKIHFIVAVDAAMPDLVLAGPITAGLFACMYLLEDNLIHLLSRYLVSLTRTEQYLNGGPVIVSWDASPELEQYTHGHGLTYRLVVQLSAFLLFPGVFIWEGAARAVRYSNEDIPWLAIILTVVNVSVLVVIAAGFIVNHYLRKGSTPPGSPPVAGTQPVQASPELKVV